MGSRGPGPCGSAKAYAASQPSFADFPAMAGKRVAWWAEASRRPFIMGAPEPSDTNPDLRTFEANTATRANRSHPFQYYGQRPSRCPGDAMARSAYRTAEM